MGILKVIATALSLTPAVPADQIIAAMEPWTLACAVGAENGAVGVQIGFDRWLRLSRENWMPNVKLKIGASDGQIENALRQFVQANRSRHMNLVLREEEAKRGQAHTPVLGPGESITITVPLTVK